MDKEIDRIPKNQDTDIIIRIDEFNGTKGLTIREFVKSERYTGFTKAGTRIPADKFHLFKKAINMVDEKDLEGGVPRAEMQSPMPPKSTAPVGKSADKKQIKRASTEQFDEVEF